MCQLSEESKQNSLRKTPRAQASLRLSVRYLWERQGDVPRRRDFLPASKKVDKGISS